MMKNATLRKVVRRVLEQHGAKQSSGLLFRLPLRNLEKKRSSVDAWRSETSSNDLSGLRPGGTIALHSK